MKRSYSAAFKAQVVLELLKETKTLTQLAATHSVHPNVLCPWRDQALKDFADLSERRDSFAATQAAHEKQLEEVCTEIGRLTTQVNFLKRSCRREPR
jgi:putative transposase